MKAAAAQEKAMSTLREAWRRLTPLQRSIKQAQSLIPHDLNTVDGVMVLAIENARKAAWQIAEVGGKTRCR